MIGRFLKWVSEFLRGIGASLLEQSTEALQLEYLELEHAFLSIVLGSLVGIPLLPLGLAVELAPYIKDEISVLVERSRRGTDALADLFSTLGGEW